MASQGIDNLAEEVIYTALGHNDFETSRLPLSPNSLSFTDKEVDLKYNARLLGLTDEKSEMSITFKNNILLFSVSLLLFCIVSVTTHIVSFYRNHHLEVSNLELHLVCLSFLLALGVTLLLAVRMSLCARAMTKKVYFYYMVLMIAYLIICDQRVLAKITNNEYYPDHSNYTIALMLFLYLYKLVSFAYFLGVFLLCAFAIGLYLVVMLLFSPQDQIVTIADVLYLTVFCVLLCFHTHQTEYRARNLFYRIMKEEAGSDLQRGSKRDPISPTKGFNTEAEKLIEICEDIRKKVKAAASVVIFSDIKQQLKDALGQLDKVKSKLAKGKLNEIDQFEPKESIDEDDMEFIRQQFYHQDPEAPKTHETAPLKYQNRRASIVNISELGMGMDSLGDLVTDIASNWAFDIWKAHKAINHSIAVVGKYLLKKWELFPVLRVPELISDQFFVKMEKMYAGNPYHNACHAADVCHSLLYFLETSGLLKKLTEIDLVACIIAALGHDIGHPGFTNRFIVNNREKLALRYNDSSVLENMHISLIYKLMLEPDRNLLAGLSGEEWLATRKIIIELVLHTDMSKHFEALGQFRSRSQTSLSMDNNDDKTLVLAVGLKCADIGHTAKPTELHMYWTELITEEFFHQGDVEKERGQAVSMYCDRDTADVPKSQAGFLKNICVPLYEAWTSFLGSTEINEKCLEQMLDNLMLWEGKAKAKRASVLLLVNTLVGKEAALGNIVHEIKHNAVAAVKE